MKITPIIKWSGSKRSQASEIIKLVPIDTHTFYEPFCGSCAVTQALLESAEHAGIKHFVCSDVNEYLIGIMNLVKHDPHHLIDSYISLNSEMGSLPDDASKAEFYYDIRKKFNMEPSPELFMFLSHTAFNGMIRFNKKGEFKSPFAHCKSGMNNDAFSENIMCWHKKFNERDVTFIQQSYDEIHPAKGDFVYMDPPYITMGGMYFGLIDYDMFYAFLRSLPCHYAFSFDGKSGDVPEDVYSSHWYLYFGYSNFKRYQGKRERVFESLYIS